MGPVSQYVLKTVATELDRHGIVPGSFRKGLSLSMLFIFS